MDSPYVLCYERVGLDQRLGDVVITLAASVRMTSRFVLDDVLTISRLYYQLFAIEKWAYWVRYMDF